MQKRLRLRAVVAKTGFGRQLDEGGKSMGHRLNALFLAIYLLATCLDGEDMRLFRSCCVFWTALAAVLLCGLAILSFMRRKQRNK